MIGACIYAAPHCFFKQFGPFPTYGTMRSAGNEINRAFFVAFDSFQTPKFV